MWSMYDILPAIIYAVIVICLYWYMTIPKNLPPGPMGLPFIGSSLYTLEAKKQHLILAEWAKIYGPIYRVYIGARLVIILADWSTIQEALVKKGEAFSGRPRLVSFQPPGIPHNHGIIFSDGEVWKEHRQFAATTLRDFGLGRSLLEPRIREEVEFLIREIRQKDGKPFDIEKITENAVSNIICAMLFGRRYDYKDAKFRDLLNALKMRANQSSVGFLSPFILSSLLALILSKTPVVKRFQKAGVDFTQRVKDETEAAAKRFDPNVVPTNYVHAFMQAQREQRNPHIFTDAQLVAIGVELFAAGTETTANTIRWAVLFLALNPHFQQKMYEEIRDAVGCSQVPAWSDRDRLPFTDAVIMETQRVANLVPLSVMHRTMSPTKVCGYDIPGDTLVIPLLSAVLSDPKSYPEPQQFDPYRFLDDNNAVKKDPKLIPFSVGKRICLGEPLAKMELFLFFTGIFSRFKFTFPPNEPPPSTEGSVGFTNIPKSFRICAIPRDE